MRPFSAAFSIPRWLGAAFVAFLLSAVAAADEKPALNEDEVKATLLFNFCFFVQWPEKGLGPADGPFVLGIIGKDPFGRLLDDLVKGERVHGRPIQVRRFGRVEEISQANLVYVSASERPRLARIAAALRARAILSVGEESFARAGGIVEFVPLDANVKLRVNLRAAKRAGLVISPRMLRLAEVVNEGP